MRKWIPSSPWLAGALTLVTGLCALLVSSTWWLGVVVVVLGSAATVGLGLWQRWYAQPMPTDTDPLTRAQAAQLFKDNLRGGQ
jgi:hypothetical protein